MAKVKAPSSSTPKPKMRPALTPEARENQMISLAVDLAEQQLRDGTASSQVITHFLKLGSTKERLELEKIRKEILQLEAKTKAIGDSEDSKRIYEEALRAMRKYSGNGGSDDDY